MTESEKIQYKSHWYKIVLWEDDGLYHADIYTHNEFNIVHTTDGYLAFRDVEIVAKAVIDFMEESK